jgi:hypothetical protein
VVDVGFGVGFLMNGDSLFLRMGVLRRGGEKPAFGGFFWTKVIFGGVEP